MASTSRTRVPVVRESAEKTSSSEIWHEALTTVVAMRQSINYENEACFATRLREKVEGHRYYKSDVVNDFKGNIGELAALCILRANYRTIRHQKQEYSLKTSSILDPQPRLAGLSTAGMSKKQEKAYMKNLPWFAVLKRSMRSKAKYFDIIAEYSCRGEKQPLYVLAQVKYGRAKPHEVYVNWKEKIRDAGHENVLFWWFTFDKNAPAFLEEEKKDDPNIRSYDARTLNQYIIQDICDKATDILKGFEDVQHARDEPVGMIPTEIYGKKTITQGGREKKYVLRQFQFGLLHHLSRYLEGFKTSGDSEYPNVSTIQHCGCGKTIALWAVLHWFTSLTAGLNILITPRLVLNSQSLKKMHEWDCAYGQSEQVSYFSVSGSIATLEDDDDDDFVVDDDVDDHSTIDGDSDGHASEDDSIPPEDMEAVRRSTGDFNTLLNTNTALREQLKVSYLECKKNPNKRVVLVCTYHSCKRLVQVYHEAVEELFEEGHGFDIERNPFFGMIGFDESHMACNIGYKAFKACHLLPASLKLFMTATPKFKSGVTSLYDIHKYIIESDQVDHGTHTEVPDPSTRSYNPTKETEGQGSPPDFKKALAMRMRDENTWHKMLGEEPGIFEPLLGSAEDSMAGNQNSQQSNVFREALTFGSWDETEKYLEQQAKNMGVHIKVFDVIEYAGSNLATINVQRDTKSKLTPAKRKHGAATSSKTKKPASNNYVFKLGNTEAPLSTEKMYGISEDLGGRYCVWMPSGKSTRNEYVNQTLDGGGLLYNQNHFFALKDLVADDAIGPEDDAAVYGKASGVGKIIHVVPQHVAMQQGVIAQDHSWAMDLTFLTEEDNGLLETGTMMVRMQRHIEAICDPGDVPEGTVEEVVTTTRNKLVRKINKEKIGSIEMITSKDIIKVAYILKVFMTDMKVKDALQKRSGNSSSKSSNIDNNNKKSSLEPVRRPNRRMLIRCGSVLEALTVQYLLQAMANKLGISKRLFVGCLYRTSVHMNKDQTYEDNLEIKNEFTNKDKHEFAILTTYRLVEVGWDCPMIDSACAYSPIENIQSLVQFTGRAARITDGDSEEARNTYDYFYCVERDSLDNDEGITNRGALLKGGNTFSSEEESRCFRDMAEVLACMRDGTFSIMGTFESLKEASEREDASSSTQNRSRKGMLRKRQAQPCGNLEEEVKQDSSYFLLSEKASACLVKNIEHVRFYIQSLEKQRDIQFWLQVFREFADEQRQDPSFTGEIRLPGRGNEKDDDWKPPSLLLRLGQVTKGLRVARALDTWKKIARGQQRRMKNPITVESYKKLLSEDVKQIFGLQSPDWWVVVGGDDPTPTPQEKIKALELRWEQHHHDEGFDEIPKQRKKERNAEYDLNDGKGPRKFNLGKFIQREIEAYKNNKRTNEEMEELMSAMHLSDAGITDFKKRCLCRENGIALTVAAPTRQEKIKALELRWEQHHHDEGFDEIPKQRKEGNAEYDLNDGKGPRKFNLGWFIEREISEYKKNKRTNEQMEELMSAMHLSDVGITDFKKRCRWRENDNTN